MKRIRMYLALGLIGLTGMTSCTINKPQETTRKITVNGTGSVLVDQSVITLEVRARDFEKDNAVSLVTEVSEKILNAAGIMKLDSNDISETGNQISSEKGQTVWIKNSEGVWVSKDDYTICSNQIKVTLKDISRTKDVCDVLLKAAEKNTAILSIDYKASGNGTELRQARNIAVQNAQDTANFLAGASGCKVDKVLEIVENETVYKTVSSKSILPANRNDFSDFVQAVNVSVQSNVTITYSLMD